MRDNLLNARFTNRDAPSPGSATQLCCTRPNVYKIFRKENIDIHLLWRISCILGHDFFRDLSDSINTGNFPSVSK
ncbi:hypothetical protein OU990_25590 [Bacteroides ovatus]|nr:hypothetical protein [Bacteroides ovatus]MDC2394442.1 hypothetical protein [Bacteroides ovatus]MDC2481150.1 hypothetical protein [Bacteroides ovatus]WII03774.1 hypothetical protein OU990_25590 [Bacteroides ovatus]